MDSSLIWYSCSFCKRPFKERSSLIEHKKNVHLEDMREKRRQLCFGSEDSSSEDEDNGPLIQIGHSESTSRPNGNSDGCHSEGGINGEGITGSVTFWTESTTTEIVYLSGDDDDDGGTRPLLETTEVTTDFEGDADQDVILDGFTCKNCDCHFQNETKFKRHVNSCYSRVSALSNRCDSFQVQDPFEFKEDENDTRVQDEIPIRVLEVDMNHSNLQDTQELNSKFQEASKGKPEDLQTPIDLNEPVVRSNQKLNSTEKVAQFLKVVPWVSPKGCSHRRPKKQKCKKTQPKIFACTLCAKSFSWRKSLNLHQRNVHPPPTKVQEPAIETQSPQDLPHQVESEEITVEPDLTHVTHSSVDDNIPSPDPNDQPEQEPQTSNPVPILTQLINTPIKSYDQISHDPSSPFPQLFPSIKSHPFVEVDEFMSVFCQICFRNFPNGRLLAEHLKVCQLNQNLALLVMYFQNQQNQLLYWNSPIPLTAPFMTSLTPSVPPLSTTPPRPPTPLVHPTPPDNLENMDSSLDSADRVYRCPTCHKTFPKKWSLTAHTKTHTRPYACTICSRSFSKGHNLKMHYVWHGKALHKKTFNCDSCPQSFGDIGSLCRHQKILHSTSRLTNSPVDPTIPQDDQQFVHVEGPPSSPASFPCQSCPRSFSKQSALTQHLRIHNSFKCSFCSSILTSALELARHVSEVHVKKRQEVLCWEDEYLRLHSVS